MYSGWQALPAEHRADLRGKAAIDLSLTDKEIFAGLPRGDLWIDSRIHEVFLYLYSSKYLQLHGLHICLHEKPQAEAMRR